MDGAAKWLGVSAVTILLGWWGKRQLDLHASPRLDRLRERRQAGRLARATARDERFQANVVLMKQDSSVAVARFTGLVTASMLSIIGLIIFGGVMLIFLAMLNEPFMAGLGLGGAINPLLGYGFLALFGIIVGLLCVSSYTSIGDLSAYIEAVRQPESTASEPHFEPSDRSACPASGS